MGQDLTGASPSRITPHAGSNVEKNPNLRAALPHTPSCALESSTIHKEACLHDKQQPTTSLTCCSPQSWDSPAHLLPSFFPIVSCRDNLAPSLFSMFPLSKGILGTQPLSQLFDVKSRFPQCCVRCRHHHTTSDLKATLPIILF